MIRSWSIRNRVLLLALLPVLCLGLALGSYFIRSRVHFLQLSQSELGRALASQLAQASEYGVLNNNLAALHNLAQSAAAQSNVEAVTISDAGGRVLARTTRAAPRTAGFMRTVAQRIGAQTGFQDFLVFTQPIVRPSAAGDGSAEQSQAHAPHDSSRILGQVTVELSQAGFAQRQTRIIVNGGIILLIGLALSILLALAISGSVVAPIGRIIAMVRRFSLGDHSARVPLRSGGELGRLEHDINAMAANAQRTQDELQEQVVQATAELRETMEELEIKNVEIDLARKHALEASRAKSAFLANMSHEIRTPMNAVLGFSDLLAKTPLDAGQRHYLVTLRQSAHTLLALLDDVLQAAHLETGQSSVHSGPFALTGLLEEVVQISAMDAYAKRLELVLHIEDDIRAPLLGDRAKLSRILNNLVTNAVKFTDAGSLVVHARSTLLSPGKAQVEIKISDTGVGIHAADQRRLFEPFFQANGAADRRHGGAGLGLYITRRLVEQLDGSLTFTSAPGHGSEFRLRLECPIDEAAPLPSTLPVADGKPRLPLLVYEPHPQAAVALRARLARLGWQSRQVDTLSQLQRHMRVKNLCQTYAGAVLSLGYDDPAQLAQWNPPLTTVAGGFPVLALVSSVNDEVLKEISRRIGGPCLPKSLSETAMGEQLAYLVGGARPTNAPAKPAAQATLRGLTVLIADDNRLNRVLARILLEKHGATVVEAGDGAQALQLVQTRSLDLILLDMHMPGEDGWRVAARLKSRFPGPNAPPIIALSAMDNELPAQTLMEHGLSDWLRKPLEEDVLLASVLKHRRTVAASGRLTLRAPSPESADSRMLSPALRQILREELPQQWQAVEQAWRGHDWPELREQLHKLNGSAAFCRLHTLRVLCDQAENRLRGGERQNMPELLAQIGREIAETVAKLDSDAVSSAAGP